MKFENVIDWFSFVNNASLADLRVIITDEFYLYKYLHSQDICILNENLINTVKEKLKGTELEERFWSECLFYIHKDSLNDELIDYLITNRISILKLGHLLLPDKFLLRIANQVDEAVLTLGKRYYTDKNYSSYDFAELLKNFKDNEWLWRSLVNMDSECDEKRRVLLKSLFSITDFKELKRLVVEQQIEKHLAKTKSTKQIEKYYRTNNFCYIRAIAENPITPIYILNELVNIKNVKYANQIRTLASKNLSMKMQ